MYLSNGNNIKELEMTSNRELDMNNLLQVCTEATPNSVSSLENLLMHLLQFPALHVLLLCLLILCPFFPAIDAFLPFYSHE